MINKKFLLAGLAAFAYYRYQKMNPQQRKDIVDTVKKEGRKLWNQINPSKGFASNAHKAYAENPATPNYQSGPTH